MQGIKALEQTSGLKNKEQESVTLTLDYAGYCSNFNLH
jgi:hypothetical protein